MASCRLGASVAWAWATAMAAGCTPSEPHPEQTSALDSFATPSPPSNAPKPSQAGEGTLRRIADRQDVALRGPRVDARPGDWLLENAGNVAVVDTRGGRIVDFGASAGDDTLVGIEPTAYLGLEDMRSDVVSVGPDPDAPHILRIERRVHDAPLRLWTFVSFVGSAVRIESVATSTGDASPAVTIGEKVGWGNVPTWVEGTGFVTKGGSFTGDFLAAEGLGEAYALGRPDGRIVARFNAPQPGFHERAHTGEDATRISAGGTSPRRVLLLAHAHGRIGDAVVELLRAEGVPLDPIDLPAVAANRAVAEMVRCPTPRSADGLPFAHFALSSTAREAVMPHGCFRMRATAPGYADGAWTSTQAADASPSDLEPRAGLLRWHVTERGGSSLPARLSVRGIPPTRDPDWGDEPNQGAALESVYTLGDGSIPIPPGRYRVTVSRGFEYTTHDEVIALTDGSTASVDATLERVVDTRGWISADMHVHAVPSPDAPTLLEDRVRSLVASGVEVAVATDHNAITDYGPTIRALGAQRWLSSIVGDEVTTRGIELGHFNVFPLTAGTPPLPFESITPGEIFAAARAAAPRDRDRVVQVNHPRMGSIGYFELLHLDPDNLDGWRRRAPLFDSSFDAIEVFNGDDYAELAHVEACLRDWYALLNAGLRITATGNSDSHKLTYHEAGVPRNFVRIGSDSPAEFDEATFIEAVRRGKVVVSSGPFVRLASGAAEVGDDVAPGSDVEVHVRVDAPPWVDVSSVDLVRRGEVVKTWAVGAIRAPIRLDAGTRLSLRSGDWIIAIARGSQPMNFLHRSGALPFGFTNPIRVR
jgi:hypothetical protein